MALLLIRKIARSNSRLPRYVNKKRTQPKFESTIHFLDRDYQELKKEGEISRRKKSDCDLNKQKKQTGVNSRLLLCSEKLSAKTIFYAA